MKKKKLYITFCMLMLLSVAFNPAKAQLQNARNIPYPWKTDTTKKTVSLKEFTVAVPKGAFAVLNHPSFIDAQYALKKYLKHEPVISVAINGNAKA